jgi:hypothetical protein
MGERKLIKKDWMTAGRGEILIDSLPGKPGVGKLRTNEF